MGVTTKEGGVWMNFDLLGVECSVTDSQYGFHVAQFQRFDNREHSLLSFYWIDRECYLSVLWMTFDWVCLIGWEDGK